MDLQSLADDILRQARASGADAADVLVAQARDFSLGVRLGALETLEEADTKAAGLRVFVGRRSALMHTSDFSPAALAAIARDCVAVARATGEDPGAGLPDEVVPPEDLEQVLGLFDPSGPASTPDERKDWALRAEAAALRVSPEITNIQGAGVEVLQGQLALANTAGFSGYFRRTSVGLSVAAVAERAGTKERDYWSTEGRGLADLLSPEEVGRVAAERTLRRLGARPVPTCDVPVVFDPETASSLVDEIFGALSGYAVFRNATFLRDALGQQVAAPLVTLVDDGRRVRGLGSRPFDGEGLPTRRSVPIESGRLQFFMCDSYAARRLGVRPNGCARRAATGPPSVAASNLYLAAGSTPPAQIIAEVERGLYVTSLMGSGVNRVTGDYSRGACGVWIEHGRLTHAVNEVTIAGNLRQMLLDIDAVGDDLLFRGTCDAPTLRVRRMTVSGT
jgi:PmbA protein